MANNLNQLANDLFPYLIRYFYEGTTYTPTYGGSTTAGTTTYTDQQGVYRRLGDNIWFALTMTWTNATGTGNARFLLPFTSANVSSQNVSAMIWMSGITFANGSVQGLIGPNVQHLRLFSPITNGANTEVAIEVAGTIVASGWFLI